MEFLDHQHRPEQTAQSSSEFSPQVIAKIAQIVAHQIAGRALSKREITDVIQQVDPKIASTVREVRTSINCTVRKDEGFRSKVTPPQLAKRWGIAPHKVLAWIRSGELRATNVATRLTGRPRYLIDKNEIEKFEARRTTAKLKTMPRQRALRDTIEFF